MEDRRWRMATPGARNSVRSSRCSPRRGVGDGVANGSGITRPRDPAWPPLPKGGKSAADLLPVLGRHEP